MTQHIDDVLENNLRSALHQYREGRARAQQRIAARAGNGMGRIYHPPPPHWTYASTPFDPNTIPDHRYLTWVRVEEGEPIIVFNIGRRVLAENDLIMLSPIEDTTPMMYRIEGRDEVDEDGSIDCFITSTRISGVCTLSIVPIVGNVSGSLEGDPESTVSFVDGSFSTTWSSIFPGQNGSFGPVFAASSLPVNPPYQWVRVGGQILSYTATNTGGQQPLGYVIQFGFGPSGGLNFNALTTIFNLDFQIAYSDWFAVPAEGTNVNFGFLVQHFGSSSAVVWVEAFTNDNTVDLPYPGSEVGCNLV